MVLRAGEQNSRLVGGHDLDGCFGDISQLFRVQGKRSFPCEREVTQEQIQLVLSSLSSLVSLFAMLLNVCESFGRAVPRDFARRNVIR